ncbi:MAG: SpoIID/LytB domain-containing protein [Acidobacteriota bacterium]|nr:SpoIID/LytB domain-containing protein [Acidobacteriota bacterium]
MFITPKKIYKFFIIIFLFLFIFGGQPIEFGKDNSFFHGYSIEKPVIRIGLGVNLRDIKVSSSSGMNVYEVKTNYRCIAEDISEVYIRGRKEKLSEKFVIQVAQDDDQEKAELIAQDLRSKIEQKVYVEENKEKIIGTYTVIVGDFMTRGDALHFIKKLNELGIKDTWILQEEITEGESRPLWILVNDELKSLSDETVLYFIPSNHQSYLSFNQRDYRGIFVLKATPQGIVLINILNLEDYLKGVVPSELSPYTFNELEAHKAQAVAARTYAIKNLNQYEDLGFDLIDTPKSQFYQGMNAEHPLSNMAVEQTKGELAFYKGRLINALYTSTCGGQTENVEEVFQGPALPYLRSTKCIYEKQKEWILTSQNTLLPVYVNEQNISLKIATLMSLKIIPQEKDPIFYREKISSQEAAELINNALLAIGKTPVEISVPSGSLSLVNLTNLLIHAFGWQERVENLLLQNETQFILKDLEGWPEDSKASLAYLIKSGIFPSLVEKNMPNRLISRGELILYLWKVLLSYEELFHEGVFIEIEKNMLHVNKGEDTFTLTVAPNAFFIKNFHDENYSFTSKLLLLGGERVRWIEKDNEVKLLEVFYPAYTNIMDRSSSYHSWQFKISREKLSQRIKQYYPIGELVDIVPQKRGVSNRVTELLIYGSESNAVVKGLRISRVLGLKETLFVVDREYDDNGQVTNFIFNGKGWGHGVGLCQVGAFGMARSGAGYKEILKKYYHGIKISKNY